MFNDSGAELSLRHFPGSDISLSIQLPGTSTEDLLLADDNGDFFRDADITINTPIASRIMHEELTLSQLTPKFSASGLTHRPLASYRVTDPSTVNTTEERKEEIQRRSKQHTRPAAATRIRKPTKFIPQDGASPSRFESLMAEVDSLFSGLEDGGARAETHSSLRSPVRRKPLPKLKHTVLGGGISKAPRGKKILAKSSFFRKDATKRPLVSEPTQHNDAHGVDPQHSIGADYSHVGSTADTSLSSIPSGGVADRLLMYSQKLAGSFVTATQSGVYEGSSSSVSGQPGTTVTDNGSEGNRPLTLSQLSPCKAEKYVPTADAIHSKVPVSPLRPPTKRPVSVTDEQQRKKGKLASPPIHNAPVLQPSTRRNYDTLGLPSGSRGRIHRDGKVTVKTPRPASSELENVDNQDENGGSSSTSSCLDTTLDLRVRSKKKPTGETIKAPRTDSASKPERIAPCPRSITHFALNPTKPIGFNFQLEARMEARKAEFDRENLTSQKQKKHHNPLPVPDFKTLHAAQEAELASRREKVAPVVPLPLELNTEGRAREREKFDEMLKERERAINCAIEERKREQAAREEREIRELRKQAVPRAHEVPGWYKEAPKRKHG